MAQNHTTIYKVDYTSDDATVAVPKLLEAMRSERICCPACDERKVSDNGCRNINTLSFCCDNCGEQFDASALCEVEVMTRSES